MWFKATIRLTGAADAVLSVLGICWLLASGWGGTFSLQQSPETPYFRIAFAAMTAINVAFLILFLFAAFQLLRLRKSGVTIHAITSTFLVAYSFLVGILWLAPHNIGRSIGAATGVGNMGIAPFELLFGVPYLYPIASTLVLLALRGKITAAHATAAGTANAT